MRVGAQTASQNMETGEKESWAALVSAPLEMNKLCSNYLQNSSSDFTQKCATLQPVQVQKVVSFAFWRGFFAPTLWLPAG